MPRPVAADVLTCCMAQRVAFAAATAAGATTLLADEPLFRLVFAAAVLIGYGAIKAQESSTIIAGLWLAIGAAGVAYVAGAAASLQKEVTLAPAQEAVAAADKKLAAVQSAAASVEAELKVTREPVWPRGSLKVQPGPV